MKVKFIASIEGNSCLTFDADGAGKLKLAVPASELASLASLLNYRERALQITIEPIKES